MKLTVISRCGDGCRSTQDVSLSQLREELDVLDILTALNDPNTTVEVTVTITPKQET